MANRVSKSLMNAKVNFIFYFLFWLYCCLYLFN
jgi:hypothetical protein